MHRQSVKPPYDRWYVIRAEQYIKSFSDLRLADHSRKEVTGYLENLGNNIDLSAWQFTQAVDAIQKLFVLIGNQALAGFDWSYLKGDSMRKHSKNLTHPGHPGS
ncbi:MAG: hypothetical protein MAG794_00728 [Gammaproteobacteria bacterium]|nr:hypothetical protein [Gammaproteobacteria bacterium]